MLPSANAFGAVSSFNDSKSVGSEEGTANGIAFNPDGTKMYVVGFAGKIFEYALSTPFSVSSANYSTGEDCDYTSIGDTLRSQDLKFFKEKVAKILIHGFLHLLGFDHKKNKDYSKMLKEENLLFKSVQSKIN